MGRTSSTQGREEKCKQDFGGEARRKKETTRKLRCRQEDNIKIDKWILGWGGLD
jgi:hypothetical protein